MLIGLLWVGGHMGLHRRRRWLARQRRRLVLSTAAGVLGEVRGVGSLGGGQRAAILGRYCWAIVRLLHRKHLRGGVLRTEAAQLYVQCLELLQASFWAAQRGLGGGLPSEVVMLRHFQGRDGLARAARYWPYGGRVRWWRARTFPRWTLLTHWGWAALATLEGGFCYTSRLLPRWRVSLSARWLGRRFRGRTG